MVLLTFSEDIVVHQDIVFIFGQRNRGEMIVLRVLPHSGTDKKTIALSRNILTTGAVINGDDTLGRLLKQPVDRRRGVIVEPTETLCALSHQIGVFRNVLSALLRITRIKNRVVVPHD